MPSKPIERSYAGPGLLARIVTAKFVEHMLYAYGDEHGGAGESRRG